MAFAKGRDAVIGLQAAVARAEELVGRELLADCGDPVTGGVGSLRVVSDNGAAFKSDAS